MKRKSYVRPKMKVFDCEDDVELLVSSIYTTTTGLNAMDDDEILGDGAQSDGNSLWGMGADEDL